jgi:uncharacterized protein YbaR (Trm112 family)
MYACPACKSSLLQEKETLRCPTCSQIYPINAGIPDFVVEELSQSRDPVLRRMTNIDS